jgi:hypothetical protein
MRGTETSGEKIAGLQAHPGDWRKQLLEAMGAPAGDAHSPAPQGDASGLHPSAQASGRSAAAPDGTEGPGAERGPSDQPAVRWVLSVAALRTQASAC